MPLGFLAVSPYVGATLETKNPKPFKTVEEQVGILESRGVHFSDKEDAARFLLRENYYVVINGYKDAFLDKEKTNLSRKDCYKEGTKFESFKRVYVFDKALRDETMNVLLEAESSMKTATVYAFCEEHGGVDEYLDPACYCSKSEYKPEENYTRGLIRLLSALQGIRDNRPHKQYVKHYVNAHQCLPLWVASKCLTFGNMSAFFDYQQQQVKTKTCVALARSLGVSVVKQKQLSFAYHTLPSFRNICAHDERLYCSRVGKHEDMGFDQLLRALKAVITRERLGEFSKSVLALLDDVAEEDPSLERVLLDGMKISRAELESLL